MALVTFPWHQEVPLQKAGKQQHSTHAEKQRIPAESSQTCSRWDQGPESHQACAQAPADRARQLPLPPWARVLHSHCHHTWPALSHPSLAEWAEPGMGSKPSWETEELKPAWQGVMPHSPGWVWRAPTRADPHPSHCWYHTSNSRARGYPWSCCSAWQRHLWCN